MPVYEAQLGKKTEHGTTTTRALTGLSLNHRAAEEKARSLCGDEEHVLWVRWLCILNWDYRDERG